MSELNIKAQAREQTKRKVRQLRRQGIVPVVVYGPATEAVNLQVTSRDLEHVLQHGAYSQLVTVDVEDGGMHNILVREVQRDPVSHAYVHADFYAVNMEEVQQVSVTVNPVGESEYLETGLMMFQALDSVEIRALPSAIPAQIEVDVTGVSLENSITIADLPELEGVTYVGDPDETVFTMITTRVEEEEEEEIEEEMLEPEVLGKGGAEEEEEAIEEEGE
jgi:large subunit ribosomal protein L25